MLLSVCEKKFFCSVFFCQEQLEKKLPAMQETPVLFLGQKEPLEKGTVTHSNILA